MRFCGNSILAILLILCSNALADDQPAAHRTARGTVLPVGTDGESADSTLFARSQTTRRAISRRQVLSRRLTRSIDGWRYVDFATLGDLERDVQT